MLLRVHCIARSTLNSTANHCSTRLRSPWHPSRSTFTAQHGSRSGKDARIQLLSLAATARRVFSVPSPHHRGLHHSTTAMAQAELVQERLSTLHHRLLDWSCRQWEEHPLLDTTSADASAKEAATSADGSSPMLLALQALAADDSDAPAAVRRHARTQLAAFKQLSACVDGHRWPAGTAMSTLLDATTMQVGEDSDATAEQRELLAHVRWWLLGMLGSLAHTRTLDQVLQATLPLSLAISYWTRRSDSRLLALYYLIQSAPSRIYRWTHTKLAMPLPQIGHRNIGLYARHLIAELPRWPAQGLVAFAQRETELKRTRLSETRKRCAIGLGYLADHGQRAASGVDQLLAPTPGGTPGGNRARALSMSGISGIDEVRVMLTELLHCSTQALDVALAEDAEQREHELGAAAASTHVMSAEEVHFALLKLDEKLSAFQRTNSQRLRADGPPRFLTRAWPLLVAGLLVGPWAIGTLFSHRYDLVEWVREAGTTTRAFLTEWLWRPVQDIYETIRHREGRLGVMGKSSLSSDLDSLERMVVDFAREKGSLSELEVEVLRTSVRDGDMSVVLRAYEQEIKSPVRSALLGHLVRVLLIQVQKGKVDLELAMAALDKLLRANELNFAFLTAAPVLLISYATSRWARARWHQRRSYSTVQAEREVRAWLRRTDRVLNRSSSSNSNSAANNSALSFSPTTGAAPTTLVYQAHGLVLCNTHMLRTLTPRLAISDTLRGEWLEDLRELEDTRWTPTQRLHTITRMHRTYAFLGPARN